MTRSGCISNKYNNLKVTKEENTQKSLVASSFSKNNTDRPVLYFIFKSQFGQTFYKHSVWNLICVLEYGAYTSAYATFINLKCLEGSFR